MYKPLTKPVPVHVHLSISQFFHLSGSQTSPSVCSVGQSTYWLVHLSIDLLDKQVAIAPISALFHLFVSLSFICPAVRHFI